MKFFFKVSASRKLKTETVQRRCWWSRCAREVEMRSDQTLHIVVCWLALDHSYLSAASAESSSSLALFTNQGKRKNLQKPSSRSTTQWIRSLFGLPLIYCESVCLCVFCCLDGQKLRKSFWKRWRRRSLIGFILTCLEYLWWKLLKLWGKKRAIIRLTLF